MPVYLLLGNDSALNEMDNKKAASFDKLTTDFLALKPDAKIGVVEGAGSTYCMISKPKETVDVLHSLLNGVRRNVPFMRCFTLIVAILFTFSVSTVQAQKIPLTVGAAAMMDLASDRLYHEFGANLSGPDSEFDVRLMVRGEGGSDEQNFNSVRRGRMQMGGISYGAISTVIPELAVLNAPFLFDSYEEIDFVLAAGLEDTVNAMMEDVGLVGLGQNTASWHIVYSKLDPILWPEDAKEVRMRSRVDESSILFLQALDADVIHISATEVIPSLQTGLIDAGETNSFVYFLNWVYTEAPQLTLTNHVPSVTAFIANQRWWTGMTQAQRDTVIAALAPRETWNGPHARRRAASHASICGAGCGDPRPHRRNAGPLERGHLADPPRLDR